MAILITDVDTPTGFKRLSQCQRSHVESIHLILINKMASQFNTNHFYEHGLDYKVPMNHRQ